MRREFSTVEACPKVFAKRGVKQEGAMTSGERGINVTMIASVNAIGNSIVHFSSSQIYTKDNDERSSSRINWGSKSSGWSNERTFSEFLDHFIAHAHPSKDNQVVLLMERESHFY